jgi:hypothetical protein
VSKFLALRKLFREHKFSELDKQAEQMRRQSWPSGRFYIDDFYNNIIGIDEDELDAAWQKRIAKIKKWADESPQSVTPKIALANVLHNYGLRARGHGWAYQVSDENGKLMQERMLAAHQALDQVKERTPDWYAAAQDIALEQGWEPDVYDHMVDECRKKYPAYCTVVFNKVNWLLPRWYGQPGDLEKYTADEAAKLPGIEGDILYARVVAHLDASYVGDAFHETKLEWLRTRSGMKEIIRRYPDAIVQRAQLAMLAMEAGDKATAETAFAK